MVSKAGLEGSSERVLTEAALGQRINGFTEYALGVSAEIKGRPEEALDHFVASALAQPGQKTLIVQVVGRLLHARQAKRAVELLKQATSAPTADPELFAWLGFAYTAEGELEEAIKANRTALVRDPELAMAYRNLALLYTENQQPEAALAVLREAALLKSPSAEFLVTIAELYTGHGRAHPENVDTTREGVQVCLDRALALDPEDPLVLQRMADGYRQNGQSDKAEPILLDLLETHPELPFVREALAEIYLQEGRKEEAARQLEAITQERPGNDRAAYFLGTLAYEDGQYAEAERLFRRTVLLRPDFEPAYYDLTAVLLNQDRAEEALKVIEQARSRFKKAFQVEFLAAVASARLERYEEAVRHFTEAEVLAAATAPERLNASFYFQFGAASERRGDYDQAEVCFRKCLELKPDFADALNYVGYMWAERGENLEEARRFIERAVELEPENAAFLDSLGWVFFKLGQPREAMPWLRKAIAVAEEPDATLYDHLGDVLAAVGEIEEARGAWRRSLEVKPDDVVRRKLEAQAGLEPPME